MPNHYVHINGNAWQNVQFPVFTQNTTASRYKTQKWNKTSMIILLLICVLNTYKTQKLLQWILSQFLTVCPPEPAVYYLLLFHFQCPMVKLSTRVCEPMNRQLAPARRLVPVYATVSPMVRG